MSIMKCSKLMIAALGISLLTANSYASETGYEVELIIYEDTTKRYIDSEEWSYNDVLNQSSTAAIDADMAEPDSQFSELDWDGAALSDALRKIQDSPGFNVLLTKRWRQTGLDRDKAYYVEIQTQPAEVTAPTEIKPANETGTILPNGETDSAEAMPLTAASINGHVRLIMSRYLHFEVNLKYSKALQPSDLDEINNSVYPVVAERRMRSREMHYIDHPLVGIIVHTTPYKIQTDYEDVQVQNH